MNPYTLIHNLKQVISGLKNDLKYSKNKNRDAIRINTLIDVADGIESLSITEYKTDIIDTLIYALIYEWLLMFGVASGKPIPLHRMIMEIDNAIVYGPEIKKRECISLLENHELVNKIRDNTVFDRDYADFDKMLTQLVQEFKMQVKWKK